MSTQSQNTTLFARLLSLTLRRFGRLKVNGLHHLNGPGGKVIVCNHVGWSDPLWLGLAAMPRMVHQMAKKELFDHPISAWFVRSGGGFPVDRNSPSSAAIKHAVSLVKQQELLLIFPTGTRAKEDVEAKRGAASIALRGASGIVPAYFSGPDRIKIRHLFCRPLIEVRFGEPIPIRSDMRSDKASTVALTEQLDIAMKALSCRA